MRAINTFRRAATATTANGGKHGSATAESQREKSRLPGCNKTKIQRKKNKKKQKKLNKSIKSGVQREKNREQNMKTYAHLTAD